MAQPVHNAPGDDVLTAYLDGELDAEARRAVDGILATDAETRGRLEALKASGRPFKDAFQLVTDAAPRDRLGAMFTQIVPPPADHVAPRRVWMSAAAVVLFASGVAIGTNNVLGPTLSERPAATVAANNAPARLSVAPGTARPNATDALQQAGRAADQAPAALGELAAAPKAAPAPAPAPLAAQPQALADAAPAARSAAPAASGAGAAGPAAPSASVAAPLPPAGVLSIAPAAPFAGGLAAAPPVPTPTAPSTTPAAGAAPAQPAPTWRQIVADYVALTTPETLSVTPANPQLAEAIAIYGSKVQLDLTPYKLMLPMASLREVRLYDYRGRPLIEASYLSEDMMSVVAFCIILNSSVDAPFAFEQRNGQNIVYWAAGGRGYMVAGRGSRESLENVARVLAQQFS